LAENIQELIPAVIATGMSLYALGELEQIMPTRIMETSSVMSPININAPVESIQEKAKNIHDII